MNFNISLKRLAYPDTWVNGVGSTIRQIFRGGFRLSGGASSLSLLPRPFPITIWSDDVVTGRRDAVDWKAKASTTTTLLLLSVFTDAVTQSAARRTTRRKTTAELLAVDVIVIDCRSCLCFVFVYRVLITAKTRSRWNYQPTINLSVRWMDGWMVYRTESCL
mmetsp:Transcript_47082/g.114926  ORF Transcript_47082/g.114926 Transcript_47082/m.114926 type:complete len:162 (+) Transcript_47082:1421-1906(+)